MTGKLMHLGKPWTGEGFPPDDANGVAVRGVDEDTPICICGVEWAEPDGTVREGHNPDCPAGQPKGVKSVTGNAHPVCTCSAEWRGEGHEKTCPARLGVAPCSCKALKWDGEGHSPECISRQVVEEKTAEHAEHKRRSKEK
jgi:hypothetical protein